jgi:hypothetical protein
MGYSGVIFAMMESAKEIEKQRKINKLNTMKKEEVYVVIDSEEKRLRAIQILSDAKEEILSGSVLNGKFNGKVTLGVFSNLWQDINTNFKTEISLDQLEQLLSPKQEIKMELDALKLIAESWGFELVEKKREIKVGDFGHFWDIDMPYLNVGFIVEVNKDNKLPYKSSFSSLWTNFRHLTDEEKANIQENW